MSNTETDDLNTLDGAAIGVTLGVFAIYHLYVYLIKPRFFDKATPYTIQVVNSEIWIKKHNEASDSPSGVLAIQTIRSSLTVGVFLGGSVIKIAADLASDFEDVRGQRWVARSSILMALLFGSFICWANVIRVGSTLGYVIGTMQYAERLRTEAVAKERQLEVLMSDVDSDISSIASANVIAAPTTKKRKKKRVNAPTIERIASGDLTSTDIPDVIKEASNMVQSMSIFFSLGIRLIFLSIPFALYAAGPVALLVSAGLLLLFFPIYDTL